MVKYNLKTIWQEKVDDFIRKYNEVVIDKEYEYSKNYNYKVAIFICFRSCTKVSGLMKSLHKTL